MFYDADGNVCHLLSDNSWNDSEAMVAMVTGENGKLKVDRKMIPYSFFKDQEVFKTPPLGWRSAFDGRFMAYYRRNNYRTFRRGTAAQLLNVWNAPHTAYLMQTRNLQEADGTVGQVFFTTHLIMKPTYIPFKEGIDKMRKGEIMGFCVSPNLAFIPDVKGKQAVYFNTSKVGVVNENNTISCEVPIIRDILKEQVRD